MGRNTARLRASSGLATAMVLSGAVLASPATAQETPPAADTERQLETVTVTTTRREESLQEVPVAVTAITSEQLDDVAPRTLQDLTGLAPNLFIGMNTAGPGAGAIFIRGLGYADIEKTQNPAAGVIVDGVFLGTNTGQLIDGFDLEQVDVNRGPQGIFFGKNTTAGVINVSRSRPTRDYNFKGSAAFGNFSSQVYKAVGNVPLGEDGGLKVGGTYRDRNGFYDNLFTDEDNGFVEYTGINIALEYDLTDWLTAFLSYDYIDQDGGGNPVSFGNPLTAEILSGGNTAVFGPAFNPDTSSPIGLGVHEVINDFEDNDRLKTHLYNATFTIETPVGELTSVTAFMDSEDFVAQDFDATCFGAPGCNFPGNALSPFLSPGTPGAINPLLPILHTTRDQTYEQFTQEIRLAGSAGPIDYLGGFYYYEHDIELDQITNGAILQQSGEDNTSWSVFGNLDWNITDTLTFSAGARAINEEKDFNTQYDLIGLFPLIPLIEDSEDFDDVITRFALDWQATDDILIYGSRAEGFRSGGFSIRGTLSEQVEGQPNCAPDNGNAIPNEILCPENNFLTYEPEIVTTWEIGTKTSFFDDQVIINAAYFDTVVDEFQAPLISVTPGFGPGTNTVISNFPEVEIDGFELETQFSPDAVEGLTLSFSGGIQDGEVSDGRIPGVRANIGPGATAGPPGSEADFTGNRIVRLAEFNYAIRGRYEFDVGPGTVSVAGGYNFIDDHSLASAFGTDDVEGGYGLLDASIDYTWENYKLTVSGKNLTDEEYRNNSLPTVFFQGFGDPLTWQIELQASF